jgi:hypothetical protein
MPVPLRALRERAAAELAAAGVPDPEVDTELLLGHVLGLGRGEVQAKIALDAEVADEDADAIRALVARRATPRGASTTPRSPCTAARTGSTSSARSRAPACGCCTSAERS